MEIGAIVYAAAFQKTRAATEAMYLMARHAFEDLGYRRYEWKCNVLNETSQRVALGAMPRSLDELHHADALSAPEHTKRKTECSGRFPLARAGMHDEKTLLDLLVRHLGILDRLALGHFCAMALAFGVIERLGHAPPFTMSGSPATRRSTRSARAAMLWLS